MRTTSSAFPTRFCWNAWTTGVLRQVRRDGSSSISVSAISMGGPTGQSWRYTTTDPARPKRVLPAWSNARISTIHLEAITFSSPISSPITCCGAFGMVIRTTLTSRGYCPNYAAPRLAAATVSHYMRSIAGKYDETGSDWLPPGSRENYSASAIVSSSPLHRHLFAECEHQPINRKCICDYVDSYAGVAGGLRGDRADCCNRF